jgi:putative ABC transport system permease protein
VTTSAGRPATVKVLAVGEPDAQLTGEVLISQAAFDARFPRPSDLYVFVRAQNGTNAATTKAIDRAVAGFPEVDAHTRSAWIDFRGNDTRQFLMLLYVLLALSVVVSLFGMVNALVLTVFERTREIGMMRAVGMTRRQVRRMVRHESIITALIGAGRAGHRVRPAGAVAGDLHDRRGHRGGARRRRAGTTGLAAQRAAGAALRVGRAHV